MTEYDSQTMLEMGDEDLLEGLLLAVSTMAKHKHTMPAESLHANDLFIKAHKTEIYRRLHEYCPHRVTPDARELFRELYAKYKGK